MQKKKKNILILIVTAALLTTGVAVALNGGWFNFIFEQDLDIADLKLDETLTLSSTPEYLQVSVTMTGTGNTGDEHEVWIKIEHIRDGAGFWSASASYALALNEMNGTLVENIDSGSFSGLMNVDFPDSYERILHWTPSASPSKYLVALNITNILWEIIPVYTITATAGPNGEIKAEGITVSDGLHDFSVMKGDPIGFTITPDSGYEIAEVLVNNVPIDTVSSYTFTDVQKDWTIHATFDQITYMASAVQTAYAGAPSWWDTGTDDGLIPRYNGSMTNTYMPGDTIELKYAFHIMTEIPDGTTCTSYTYSVVVERVDGGNLFTVVEETTEVGLWIGGWMIYYETFTAPGFGEWFATVHVTEVTWTP